MRFHEYSSKPHMPSLHIKETPRHMNTLQLSTRNSILQKIAEEKYRYETVPCAICNDCDFFFLVSQDRFGIPISLAVCKECGFVQLNPRMDEKSYDDFYSEEYRKLYVGTEEPEESFFNKQYKRGALIYKFLEENNFKFSNSIIIEIGCGAGGILQYFKEKGNEVFGVDIDERYLRYGVSVHSLDLKVGKLKDINPRGTPGLVIFSHVLEHFLNPVEELRALTNVIDDKTLIYYEVPGLKGIRQKWNMPLDEYILSSHISYFTSASLGSLLHKCGMEILYIDEFVRCIAKKDNEAGGLAPTGTPIDTYSYLKKEMKYIPLYKMKYNCRNTILHILKKIHLYHVVSRLKKTHTRSC